MSRLPICDEDWQNLMCSMPHCVELAECLHEGDPYCIDCADLLIDRQCALSLDKGMAAKLPAIGDR